jgi:hypothetical protein
LRKFTPDYFGAIKCHVMWREERFWIVDVLDGVILKHELAFSVKLILKYMSGSCI